MMKWLVSLTLFGLMSAGARGEEGATHPFSVRDMVAMERISEPRVSPNGQLVAFTVRVTDLDANRGRTDVYLAAVDGSWTKRITTHEDNDNSPRWSPDGKRLYFLSTRSGSNQVWRIATEGGEAEAVTRMPLDVDAMEVSPTGRALVFGMAVFPGQTPEETRKLLDEKSSSKVSGMLFERLFIRHWDTWSDGTRNHLFVYDLASGKTVDLMPTMDADCPTKPFGGSEDYTVSPDGKTVVFAAKDVGREEAWSTNYDLFMASADGSGAPQKLTTNPAWDAQPRYSPDGRTLAYLAMARPGYEADRFHLQLRDMASAVERTVDFRVDDSPRGDRSISEFVWANDGGALLCTADHLQQHPLFSVDAATGKAKILVGEGSVVAPQGVAGGRVLYGRHSLLGPTELYRIEPGGGEPQRVTHLNDSKVAAARFGKPEQFSFTGARGDKVYGYLVYPADFDPSRKYPVAFLIHGGPQGSFSNDFHYRWNPQAYAGAGYAAVLIDFHGSTGYGQAFTDAITDDWGGAPYQDLMKGLDFVVKKYPFLDGSRVGALGASFGGFMINWIAGMAQDRFKAFVCHDGNLDERMAYFDTEELWFPEWDHVGTPWGRPLGYTKHNPIDLARNWKTPMLGVHGAKDYRVVDTQGLSTFTLLQRKGIPSKLLYFPDENHWVLKPQNSIYWHETVIGWLDQWLKK